MVCVRLAYRSQTPSLTTPAARFSSLSPPRRLLHRDFRALPAVLRRRLPGARDAWPLAAYVAPTACLLLTTAVPPSATQAHTLIYVVPLCLAFQADPLFAVLGQLWIVATLQTFPTLGATALSVALLPLFPSLIPRASLPPPPSPGAPSLV